MKNFNLPKPIYEQLADFRYRLRKFIHFSESAAREAGLTPQQHQLLLAVKGFPGRDSVTVSELAERLQLTHHACVGLIQRCEKAELVGKRRSETDKRSVIIELTEQGEQILEQLSSKHLEELQKAGLIRIDL